MNSDGVSLPRWANTRRQQIPAPTRTRVSPYRWFMTVGYPRVKEIIEQDLGSGLIYLNSHAADFKNPKIRPYLDKYVRGSNGYDAVNRVKVMKLLWDAIGSEFGGRDELYERNFSGNGEQIRLDALKWAHVRGSLKRYEAFVQECMDDYDLTGWLRGPWCEQDVTLEKHKGGW